MEHLSPEPHMSVHVRRHWRMHSCRNRRWLATACWSHAQCGCRTGVEWPAAFGAPTPCSTCSPSWMPWYDATWTDL